MSYESGKVTAAVTGSVTTSAPALPTGATAVRKMWGSTAAGVASGAAVHTVTAGKTLYITAVYMGSTSAAANVCGLNWDGANQLVVGGFAPNAGLFAMTAGGLPLCTVAAGTAITATCNAAGNVLCGTLIGYEV